MASRWITLHIVTVVMPLPKLLMNLAGTTIDTLSSWSDSDKRWKIAKELLHSSNRDYFRTEAVNQTMQPLFSPLQFKPPRPVLRLNFP